MGYKVHQFAALAGVTVKALHHYERVGLLKPRRSESGYRLYAEQDLERLEQIIALKFLGLPLKQIKEVLDRTALALPDALRLQRQAIEEKQALLRRAARVIRAAEESLECGKPADPAVLKKIIGVIGMQSEIEAMKRYYSTDEAFEQRRRHYEEGPLPEWQQMYRDVEAILGSDPASDQAQALADRWLELSVRAAKGDPAAQTDNISAWKDREHWPPAMKQRLARYRVEEIVAFIQQAALCAQKKYFSPEAWARLLAQREKYQQKKTAGEDFSARWQARVALFRDIEATLGEDPASEKGQMLAERWMALVNDSSEGDAELVAGTFKVWADRRNWRATLRWQMEGLYGITADRFDRAADFLEAAISSAKRP